MRGLDAWPSTTLPTVVVRDIPPPVYRLLHERATLHRRSLNAELLSILEGALGPRRLAAAEILAGIERLVRIEVGDREEEFRNGTGRAEVTP
jgi:plasmid stability protein